MHSEIQSVIIRPGFGSLNQTLLVVLGASAIQDSAPALVLYIYVSVAFISPGRKNWR